MHRRLIPIAALAVIALAAVGASSSHGASSPLSKVNHIVVIYEENHSFDNLYGGGEGVNGRANADVAHTTQVDQTGAPYTCLKQNDVNLNAIAPTCSDAAHNFGSAFKNTWYLIDPLIPPTAKTCPPPLKAFSFPNGVP